MEYIIQDMLDFFRKNSGVIRRAVLVSMLNGCDRMAQWTQRREATWNMIYDFAKYMHIYSEETFRLIPKHAFLSDRTFWTSSSPLNNTKLICIFNVFGACMPRGFPNKP